MPDRVEPTKEQIQWFWKQCGFKLHRTKSPDPIYSLDEPDGEQYNIWYAYRDGTNEKFDGDAIRALYPLITLNNLFEYAVPRLLKYFRSLRDADWSLTEEGKASFSLYDLREVLKRWIGQLTGDYEKDTLALFWAIFTALGGK